MQIWKTCLECIHDFSSPFRFYSKWFVISHQKVTLDYAVRNHRLLSVICTNRFSKNRGFKRKLPRLLSALLCYPELSAVAGMRFRSRKSGVSAPCRGRPPRRCRCRRCCGRNWAGFDGRNIRRDVRSILPFADVSFWSSPRRNVWKWRREKWRDLVTCWVRQWFEEKAEKYKTWDQSYKTLLCVYNCHFYKEYITFMLLIGA